MTGVPTALAARDVRVLRPVDAGVVYSHPRAEVARLTRRGVLLRLATGYYALVPQARVGDGQWQPSLEAAAWGIAAADYGPDPVALMGLSAARIHGAIPRALSVAVVAVPKQRPRLQFSYRQAEATFASRRMPHLDVERHRLELGDAYVTTVEQTVLDLIARPQLGGVPEEAEAAAQSLLARADEALLQELAEQQRRSATLRRWKERR
jgi:predicted transcriptional regulator of viral defense system